MRHLDELPEIVAAQGRHDRRDRHPGRSPPRKPPTVWCEAGVHSILNFAPVVLTVPRGVSIRKVDLAVELQILSFYQQRRAGGAVAAVPDVTPDRDEAASA